MDRSNMNRAVPTSDFRKPGNRRRNFIVSAVGTLALTAWFLTGCKTCDFAGRHPHRAQPAGQCFCRRSPTARRGEARCRFAARVRGAADGFGGRVQRPRTRLGFRTHQSEKIWVVTIPTDELARPAGGRMGRGKNFASRFSYSLGKKSDATRCRSAS